MSLSREISAITECSICTEPFVDPRVLPCVHTFCLKCLETYGQTKQNSEGGLACPLCRAKFDIPFSDLPVNFFILKLIDVNKVARKPNENASCDACSGQNDEDDDEEEEPNHSIEIATVYCFDCRQSLCKKCFRVHNRLRHNRCHLVVEFGKKQPDDLLKLSPTFCESHQDEIVKFFCSDCEKSICMSCYVESHSTHKCSNVAKVAEDFLVQLQEDVTKVSEHIEKCLSEEKTLAMKKEQFLQLIEDKEVQTNVMMKEMSELVEAHGRQILEDLASVRSVKLKEFEIAASEIQNLLVMMESFKKYSQEVITKATPADVTRLASMLKKRAAELHTMRLDNFLKCDIDIHLLNVRQLLTSRDENSVWEVVLYNNRKDNTEAYLSSSAALPMQLDAEKGISGMTTIIGNKFYLLRTVGSDQTKRRLLATGPIRLQLTDYISLNGQNYSRASYTQCNSLLFQLQLWYSKVTDGKTLQLEISDLHLVEADTQLTHLTNSVTFTLDSTEIGQPSSINQNLTLRSPQKLHNSGFHATNINILASGSSASLTVTASNVQFSSQNYSYSDTTIVIPITYNSTLAPAAAASPSSILEVYDIDIKVSALNPGIAEVMKPSSIVFLPSINPTDMVSCCFYDCLYVGDESDTSIHRVDSRAQMTKWLVQSIPNGLSVTGNHTILVTSSQVAKLLEYTTLGVLLREICLTRVITRPSHSIEIIKNKFIVVTESELYLVSPKGAKTKHAQAEGKEKKAAAEIDSSTETKEQRKGLEETSTEEESCMNSGQEEGAARTRQVEEGNTIHETPAVEPIMDTVSAAEKQEGEETLEVTAEIIKDIGAAGVKPIRICIDQFGFIFVLTETKVHLLSPELKYVRELISLDSFGMQNPKHIHFQPESGRLYVASTGGTKQFFAFQVTEGKVDQCTWKK